MKTRDLLDTLCGVLNEARSQVDTWQALGGDNPPPWVHVIEAQLARIEQAAEVLEVQLRTQVLPLVEPLPDPVALFPKTLRGPQATE